MSLHGLWDSQLISRALRELHNYTAPTTSSVPTSPSILERRFG